MITDTISQKIAEALKGKDELKVTTYRLLASALNYEFIAKQHKLTEEEEWVVVEREIKKRKEAIEAYEKAKAQDRADKEKEEMEILVKFLPKQLSDEEIEKIVKVALDKTKATSMSDMGKVMGLVMSQVKGKADGNKVLEIVKKNLAH
ncbi:hypothetical protein A2W13_03220 [Candidatus Woesebacteria bacterium RBG_16_36_11]|uniref:Glutamyl-tRNA amidotransferase n=3 Tax=Candidatus Woeseibacteriota TaxID=1752722 RepID=A0A1F7XDH5_9BACT|nr:MAG: hypothetical protein A2Z67_00300 [Candidatus Woesebacteria bacterium RBG_13_36_22]OGM12468.1 MAG: hypothetical protein A2W13_03220 [Candidatus Woesebacteria bacterium RBG_16_36_11]OGM17349.1 MAG: hypothetical protein A2V55_00075 [Candidatus Woesebacteria bacterium RBG_19FT_COMBO_37_29]